MPKRVRKATRPVQVEAIAIGNTSVRARPDQSPGCEITVTPCAAKAQVQTTAHAGPSDNGRGSASIPEQFASKPTTRFTDSHGRNSPVRYGQQEQITHLVMEVVMRSCSALSRHGGLLSNFTK